MHLRNGFVSNSSSSSFVVAFPREVRSEEDLMDLLNWKNYDVWKYWFSNDVPSKEEMCNVLYRALQRHDKHTDDMTEEERFRCMSPFKYGTRDKFGIPFESKLSYFEFGNEAIGLFEAMKNESLTQREYDILYELEFNGVMDELLRGLPYLFSSHR